MAGHQHFADTCKAGFQPIQEISRLDAGSLQPGDSSGVIDDMVAVLSANAHGSTAEALAFLRQIYPRYPLTLRLAALVAYSRAAPAAAKSPRAQ